MELRARCQRAACRLVSGISRRNVSPAKPDLVAAELPRDAGIRRRRGAPGFVDRYNRDAATCRANEALALQHADDLARIWTSLDAGELLLGREVGHAKLLNRLNLSARSMVIVATRDRERSSRRGSRSAKSNRD